MRAFGQLPARMQTKKVERYHRMLLGKQRDLCLKRIWDVAFSLMALTALMLPMGTIALLVKLDSRGPVLFCQRRRTRYGEAFPILKFRTMHMRGNERESALTTHRDMRITPMGKILRKYKLDELPQLMNILAGDMSLVGPRPEVDRYIRAYTPEMYATFLLPAGLTGNASLLYREEEKLLSGPSPEKTYLREVLPAKMRHNLDYIQNFSIQLDMRIIWKTFRGVFTPFKGDIHGVQRHKSAIQSAQERH